MDIRKEAKEMLENVIIPFWHSLRDNDNGGFIGLVDGYGRFHSNADKGVILHSRILWFFSEVAMLTGSRTAASDANHAYCFLRSHAFDPEYGGVYWSLSFDGQVRDDSKHVYCQAFAVYALSSYYMLTGRKEVLEEAFSIYNLIERYLSDDYGYLELFTRNLKRVDDNSRLSGHGVNAYRTMNTLLHVFEAYSGLYKASSDKNVEFSLRRILEIYLNRIYSPGKHRQEVYFDRDYNSLADITSYGHDIESSWLIECGTRLLGDSELTDLVSSSSSDMAWNVYVNAYDSRGFIANECVDGVKDFTKIWWVEAEACEGFLNEYLKTGNKRYRDAAASIWKYICDYFVDKNGGEWFWAVGNSDEPIRKYNEADPWKCPYHNGRLCMNLIRHGEEYGL